MTTDRIGVTVFLGRSRLRGPAWVLVHLALYAGLLLGSAVVDEFRTFAEPSVLNALVSYAAGLVFTVPVSMVPVGVMLVVLWALRHTGTWVFRGAALVLCCLPSLLTTESHQLAYFLPAQVLLALLVRQPYSTANEVPPGWATR